jgi:hypothetical protein
MGLSSDDNPPRLLPGLENVKMKMRTRHFMNMYVGVVCEWMGGEQHLYDGRAHVHVIGGAYMLMWGCKPGAGGACVRGRRELKGRVCMKACGSTRT